MRYLKILILALMALSTNFGMAEEIPAYRQLKFMRSMKPVGTGTLGAVVLDADIYDHTLKGYNDVRVIDANKNEVPCVIKLVEGSRLDETAYQEAKAKILKLDKPSEDRIEIVFRTQREYASFPLNMVKILTREKNFEKRITLSGSNDMKNWTVIKSNIAIFDYSRIIDFRNSEIEVKGANWKYYKLVIDNFAELKEAPGYSMLVSKDKDGAESSEIKKFYRRSNFKIDGISLYCQNAVVKSTGPAQVRYPVKVDKTYIKDNCTCIEISASKAPLTEFKLGSSSDNYSRRVEVFEVISDGEKRFLSSGQIRSFRLPGLTRHENSVSFAETRTGKYLLRIVNNDSPPLRDVSVSASGHSYRVEFINNNLSTSLTFYYGGENIYRPVYDIDEVMREIIKPSYCFYKLGEAEDNPEYQGPVIVRQYKWLVWVGIGLLAAVLSWLLAINMKKLSEIEADD